ncbi:MAG: hypothetical protein M1821_004952 [Bathelium mastoideum]|nr:MAG: hypothetical protein M1821_004952 [Bathelium mastoideum]
MIVSSHPHPQPTPPIQRQQVIPPPVHTPQPPPSTTPVSSQAVASPSTPKSSSVAASVSPAPSSSRPSLSAPPPPTTRTPFYPQLPWYSKPDEPFPPKASRRRRRRRDLQFSEEPLELPSREQPIDSPAIEETKEVKEQIAVPASELETPATSQAPSESDSTQPTTPSSSLPTSSGPRPISQERTHARTQTRPAVQIIPATPIISSGAATHSRTTSRPSTAQTTATSAADAQSAELEQTENNTVTPTASAPAQSPEISPATTAVPVKAPPKSWADLVRTKAPASSPANAPPSSTNGNLTNGINSSRNSSPGETLRDFSVESERKVCFLEPRGLVNTGNMCYMNSILQVLVFCVPFYDFLDQLGKRAVHNFKSDTPLVEAMIMFMREFNIIDSAVSVEQLRMRLKDNELEQYGEAFAPEYVYDVIKQLPRFSSMRRGHQQDAEEFLGFLLEGLHDECAVIMKDVSQETVTPLSPSESSFVTSPTTNIDGGWLEVGPKQKAAITRSSGAPSIPTPITKVFGGKLRSEFRVPGLKNSVTLEPYKPLQLDIGAPQVNSITDALKNLTRSETLSGDFNSPRGVATATKQVFIETLPPVLILHLKRFQYDSSGGTQKIWKHIAYPLELEIPKEAFPPSKRGALSARGAAGGLPKYRLISVVYHHGKNATGGHYTVDVRRQEGREWIRMDDTVIRRVRSDDVAHNASPDDPRALAAALESHRRDQPTAARNVFETVGGWDNEYRDGGGEDGSDGGDGEIPSNWKEVNGATTAAGAAGGAGGAGGRKWAGVLNGTATPSTTGKRTPQEKSGVKDNKVAYILFYQQIST